MATLETSYELIYGPNANYNFSLENASNGECAYEFGYDLSLSPSVPLEVLTQPTFTTIDERQPTIKEVATPGYFYFTPTDL